MCRTKKKQQNAFWNSPAKRSLTAWWARAAGCIGGRAHDSGVRCGGTRRTWPGAYSGYEYNALAVEYGMPTCARWAAMRCSESEKVSFSDEGLLLLFSYGFDSRRDMLNGRFSLDDLVCSDCTESLQYGKDFNFLDNDNNHLWLFILHVYIRHINISVEVEMNKL